MINVKPLIISIGTISSLVSPAVFSIYHLVSSNFNNIPFTTDKSIVNVYLSSVNYYQSTAEAISNVASNAVELTEQQFQQLIQQDYTWQAVNTLPFNLNDANLSNIDQIVRQNSSFDSNQQFIFSNLLNYQPNNFDNYQNISSFDQFLNQVFNFENIGSNILEYIFSNPIFSERLMYYGIEPSTLSRQVVFLISLLLNFYFVYGVSKKIVNFVRRKRNKNKNKNVNNEKSENNEFEDVEEFENSENNSTIFGSILNDTEKQDSICQLFSEKTNLTEKAKLVNELTKINLFLKLKNYFDENISTLNNNEKLYFEKTSIKNWNDWNTFRIILKNSFLNTESQNKIANLTLFKIINFEGSIEQALFRRKIVLFEIANIEANETMSQIDLCKFKISFSALLNLNREIFLSRANAEMSATSTVDETSATSKINATSATSVRETNPFLDNNGNPFLDDDSQNPFLSINETNPFLNENFKTLKDFLVESKQQKSSLTSATSATSATNAKTKTVNNDDIQHNVTLNDASFTSRLSNKISSSISNLISQSIEVSKKYGNNFLRIIISALIEYMFAWFVPKIIPLEYQIFTSLPLALITSKTMYDLYSSGGIVNTTEILLIWMFSFSQSTTIIETIETFGLVSIGKKVANKIFEPDGNALSILSKPIGLIIALISKLKFVNLPNVFEIINSSISIISSLKQLAIFVATQLENLALITSSLVFGGALSVILYSVWGYFTNPVELISQIDSDVLISLSNDAAIKVAQVAAEIVKLTSTNSGILVNDFVSNVSTLNQVANVASNVPVSKIETVSLVQNWNDSLITLFATGKTIFDSIVTNLLNWFGSDTYSLGIVATILILIILMFKKSESKETKEKVTKNKFEEIDNEEIKQNELSSIEQVDIVQVWIEQTNYKYLILKEWYWLIVNNETVSEIISKLNNLNKIINIGSINDRNNQFIQSSLNSGLKQTIILFLNQIEKDAQEIYQWMSVNLNTTIEQEFKSDILQLVLNTTTNLRELLLVM